MNSPFFTPELQGQEVYLVPTDANIKDRQAGNPLTQVIKKPIARVGDGWIVIQEEYRGGVLNNTKYTIDSEVENYVRYLTYGYLVFKTKNDLNAYIAQLDIKEKLPQIIEQMTPSQAVQIALIMNIDFRLSNLG